MFYNANQQMVKYFFVLSWVFTRLIGNFQFETIRTIFLSICPTTILGFVVEMVYLKFFLCKMLLLPLVKNKEDCLIIWMTNRLGSDKIFFRKCDEYDITRWVGNQTYPIECGPRISNAQDNEYVWLTTIQHGDEEQRTF